MKIGYVGTRGIGLAIATALLAAGSLTGCNFTAERTDAYVMPAELKDCKIYRVATGGMSIGPTLYITKCPDGSTSTSYVKEIHTSTTNTVAR